MRIPQPEKEETESDFIDRCMADPVMVEDYQNEHKRYAVCLASWEFNHRSFSLTRRS